QWLTVPFAPALRIPFHAHEFHVGVLREIKQNLISAAIKLLWKADERFRSPFVPVGRAQDGNIETLLLDDACDSQGQQDHARLGAAKIQHGAVTSLANSSFQQQKNRQHQKPPGGRTDLAAIKIGKASTIFFRLLPASHISYKNKSEFVVRHGWEH